MTFPALSETSLGLTRFQRQKKTCYSSELKTVYFSQQRQNILFNYLFNYSIIVYDLGFLNKKISLMFH